MNRSAYGKISLLPQKTELSAEEKALSPEEKKAAALSILTAEEYTAKEERIIAAIERSQRLSSMEGKTQAERTLARVKNIVGNQSILILLLLVMALIALLLNRALIISPISRSVENLDRREPIEERGCYEMRHLASVYNEVLKENQEKTDVLTYTGSTGNQRRNRISGSLWWTWTTSSSTTTSSGMTWATRCCAKPQRR